MKNYVLDADNEKVLEEFDSRNRDKILKKYKAMNIWADVSIDISGDIVLWKN